MHGGRKSGSARELVCGRSRGANSRSSLTAPGCLPATAPCPTEEVGAPIWPALRGGAKSRLLRGLADDRSDLMVELVALGARAVTAGARAGTVSHVVPRGDPGAGRLVVGCGLAACATDKVRASQVRWLKRGLPTGATGRSERGIVCARFQQETTQGMTRSWHSALGHVPRTSRATPVPHGTRRLRPRSKTRSRCSCPPRSATPLAQAHSSARATKSKHCIGLLLQSRAECCRGAGGACACAEQSGPRIREMP